MSERRLENRFLCADLVKVDWYLESGKCTTVDAVLEDISRVGGCVQVEDPIPIGAMTHLTIGESIFAGQVSYCVFRDYGYFVGMNFSDESVWSAEEVRPLHLTNLRSLVKRADN